MSIAANQFAGPFPDLSALTNLRTLNLSYNRFPGPFPDLSALTNLNSLVLSNIQLTGAIPDLSALSNLTVLHLSSNQLTGPFPDLSALTNLSKLYLSNNGLTGPLPDLSFLTKLTTLSIGGTQLCLPDGTSVSHPNSDVESYLKGLSLPSCTVAGPEQRAALVALYNATDGANWKRNNNWLTDEPIGTWYGVFTNSYGHVTRLSLGHNQLNGTLPDLSALTNLTNVFLAGNKLSGQIPDLSALTKLQILVLESNLFTGPVPDLSALTNLVSLSLSNTHLSGQFPDLSVLTNLTRLSISNTQLTGQFPDLSALTNLRIVYLGRNSYTGSITDISALTNLVVLDLGSSQLTGQIPDLSPHPKLKELDLAGNQLSGAFPDLSTLTSLSKLSLNSNQLTGAFPDLSALTNLLHLNLGSNQLTGNISDLSALNKLQYLSLDDNQLSGEIPDLAALTSLARLDLSDNQLTGPFPDLSLLTNLTNLDLSSNRLTGPILDLHHLTDLRWLLLNDNQFTGPVPDFSVLTNLTSLNLTGNSLCLPSGATLSHSNTSVSAHLNRLNLPTCTNAETTLAPAVPQNLTPSVSGNQITLTWDAVSNAASYELRAWDSLDRQWGSIGGVITTTTYTHTGQTDGRNYYYQVRARNANDVRGAWSDRVYAAVVTPQFPPPPLSLELDLFYQKYLDVSGVVVVAPSEVSDEKMVQARDVITSMLSAKSDLLSDLAANSARIAIYPDNADGGGITQLPELWFLTSLPLGYVHKAGTLFLAGVPEEDANCGTLVHEFAHMIHYVIDERSGGEAFNARLEALYQAARNARRWQGLYAATNYREYWAEAVRFWFWETMPASLSASYSTLNDYDPDVATLVEEVFGDATLVAYCKP